MVAIRLVLLRATVGVDSVAIAALQQENEALRLEVVTLGQRDSVRLRQVELLIQGEADAIAKIDAANAGRVVAEKQRDKAKAWGKFWRITSFLLAVGVAVGFLR